MSTPSSTSTSVSSKTEWSATVDSKIIFGVVRDVLHRVEYVPLPNEIDEKLEAALLDTVSSWDLSDTSKKGLLRSMPVAVYMSSFSYAQDFNFERKLFVAAVTTCLVHIDDTSNQRFEACQTFVPRFLARQPQLDPVLERLATLLPGFSEYYDPFPASAMSMAALEFVSACCIENRVNEMTVSSSATHWPWDIRKMTGVAPLFSYVVFPRENFPDVSAYVQAIPDIERFVNLVNDVLSFYKEEVVHETGNYIRVDSRVRGVSPAQALVQCAEDTISAHDRATQILSEAHTGAADLVAGWKAFVRGYIAFHFHSKRYLLAAFFDTGEDAQEQ
ncbi:isoprenoid synthase domain-containing protein [Amylostereum chailletii]|nr:isoprenoid synthase domain-containing protein [Amylostereum chailletii]